MLRSKIKRFAPVTYNLNIKTEFYSIIKTNKMDRTRNETVAYKILNLYNLIQNVICMLNNF